jgi:hypothetical protein
MGVSDGELETAYEVVGEGMPVLTICGEGVDRTADELEADCGVGELLEAFDIDAVADVIVVPPTDADEGSGSTGRAVDGEGTAELAPAGAIELLGATMTKVALLDELAVLSDVGTCSGKYTRSDELTIEATNVAGGRGTTGYPGEGSDCVLAVKLDSGDGLVSLSHGSCVEVHEYAGAVATKISLIFPNYTSLSNIELTIPTHRRPKHSSRYYTNHQNRSRSLHLSLAMQCQKKRSVRAIYHVQTI